MHPILILSILLRVAAFVWSLFLTRRVGDLRMLFVSAMLALMATRQILTLRAQWTKPAGVELTEVPGLIVSLMAFAAVYFLGRLLQERQQVEDALRASEAQLRSLVQHVQDVIAVVTVDGHCVYVSPSAESALGYLPEELQGKDVTQFVLPDDLDRVTRAFDALFEQPGVGRRVVFSLLHADGTPHHVEMSAVAVPGSDGQLQAFAALRDQTEERRAEVERRRLEAQLFQSQKMETIGSLAGGIAHDFNNLLTPIIGNGDLLRRRLPADSRERALVEPLLDAARRAAALVRQILLFGRKAETRSTPLSLKELTEDAVRLIKASLTPNVELTTRLSSDAGSVIGDPVQLQQVLINLCTNAAHAMREGEARLELEVVRLTPDAEAIARLPGLAEQSEWWRMSVSDTGHGMDEETAKRIFEPFFTTKPVGEGSGLGLSVVHGIVSAHHGLIDVHSVPGQGTRIDVYLPLADAPAEKHISARPPGARAYGRVLFVDDEPSVYAIGKLLLEQLGYEAVCASGGAEALELFRAEPDSFDVVLTDHAMPEMTGIQLASRLRELDDRVPIILMTGFAGSDVGPQLEHLGIGQVLAKPYTVDQLSDALQKALVPPSAPSLSAV